MNREEISPETLRQMRPDPAYTELDRVLAAAYQQAASGKGKERHALDAEPFEKQQICEIGRRLQGNKAAGPLFQSVKKIYESGRLPTDRAIAELYGAINYAAAAILILEADLPNVQAFTGRCGADIQIIEADLPDGEVSS